MMLLPFTFGKKKDGNGVEVFPCPFRFVFYFFPKSNSCINPIYIFVSLIKDFFFFVLLFVQQMTKECLKQKI